MFLLRGGWDSVAEELTRLVREGRADLPVLCAAIEQIADVERPVSASELAIALAQLTTPPGLPRADANWIKNVFEDLVRQRLMVRVRDAFTTVHRDWARALISAALKSPLAYATARQALERDFNVHTTKPRRLSILWSWLRNDESGGEYIHEWVRRQKLEDWTTLIGSAADAGLVDVAMLAAELHLFYSSPHWDTLLGDAFERNESKIATVVRGAGPEDWHWLQSLFATINHARPECAARIVQGWASSDAANLFSHTHPDHYDASAWLFSGVRAHSPKWCDSVGAHLDWMSVRSNLLTAKTGDFRSIETCRDIFGHLRVPFLRSMVHAFAEAMGKALQGARLKDIRFSMTTGPVWIEPYAEEMKHVVEYLDAKQLAADLTSAGPRLWRRLHALSLFAARAGSPFAQDLVDSLGDGIIDIIREQAATHASEFVVLLWQFALGRESRRKELAGNLYPIMLAICSGSSGEQRRMLRAYKAVSAEYFASLVQELGITIYDFEGEEESSIESLSRPMLNDIVEGKLIAERMRVLEAKGDDYEISRLLEDDDGLSEVTTTAK